MATVAVDSSRMRMRSIGSEVRRGDGDDDYSANTCEAIPRGGAGWSEEVKNLVRSILLSMLSPKELTLLGQQNNHLGKAEL